MTARERTGLGRALRQMMGAPAPPGGTAPKGKVSVLMSPNRLKLFEALCEAPCSTVRALSERVGVAPAAIRWHLRKLAGAGLLRSEGSGARRTFYPSDMLEAEDLPLLQVLHRLGHAPIMRSVLESPGGSQSQLHSSAGASGHALRAMAGSGLLEVVKDGRHRRYYPSEAFRERREAFDRRSRRFRQLLLARLAQEGLAPETSGWDHSYLEIRLRAGTESRRLRLRRNPYQL